eukprot:CAMPEP_0170620132 /NCGR_PEP_ID=MMETSP0224-20130122/27894_1 /TAXON_ID=285029 /ORGANISM="Togula jolla, Strain CCCM 725" /LENGTH=660 /DNA_ID=CAMNT_0010946283 /DNA_START=1 /DNA_END=1980 /DNA_ORIENTATION=-
MVGGAGGTVCLIILYCNYRQLPQQALDETDVSWLSEEPAQLIGQSRASSPSFRPRSNRILPSPQYSAEHWQLPGGCISPGCLNWSGFDRSRSERVAGWGQCAASLEKLSRSVPRILHQTWFGDLTKAPKTLMEGCKQMHLGWSYMLWTQHEMTWLQNQKLFNASWTTYNLASDIVRWEILARFGGVYVDADSECLKSMEPLLEELEDSELECLAANESEEMMPGLVDSGTMACKSDSVSMKIMVEGMQARASSAPWMQFGPGYLTDALSHPLYSSMLSFMLLNSRTFYPAHHSNFQNFPVSKVDLSVSYTYHHWGTTFESYIAMGDETRELRTKYLKACQSQSRSPYQPIETREPMPESWHLAIDALEFVLSAAMQAQEAVFLSGHSLYGALRMFDQRPWDSSIQLGVREVVVDALLQSAQEGDPPLVTAIRDCYLFDGIDEARDGNMSRMCSLRVANSSFVLELIPYQSSSTTDLVKMELPVVAEVARTMLFPTLTWRFNRLEVPIPAWPEALLHAQKLSAASEPTFPDGKVLRDANAFTRISRKTRPPVILEMLPDIMGRAKALLASKGLDLPPEDHYCAISLENLAPRILSWTLYACGMQVQILVSVELDTSSPEPRHCQVLARARGPMESGENPSGGIDVDVYCTISGESLQSIRI